MTDTIDVAALVERLRDPVAEAIRGDGSDFADGPWETLPEKNKHGWRGDADRALAVVKDYLTPALQSQADALAEARRERPEWVADFLNRRTEVENWLRAPAQTQRKGRPVPPSPTPEEMEQWANRLGVPTEVSAYSAQPRSPVDQLRDAVEAAGGTVAYAPGGFVVHFAELLTRATTAEASLATMREALRGNWHGVFLDGRNEHGSHVLMLPERSIELEQGSNGDFLKQDAERIIAEAERLGFEVGHAVVVTFTEQNDDDLGGYYEFSTVSLAMTELMYGSTDEQREINRALGGINAE